MSFRLLWLSPSIYSGACSARISRMDAVQHRQERKIPRSTGHYTVKRMWERMTGGRAMIYFLKKKYFKKKHTLFLL